MTSTLVLRILDKAKFKSHHYWILAVLGKMKSIKNLKIHKDNITSFSTDGFKFLQKGFKYF